MLIGTITICMRFSTFPDFTYIGHLQNIHYCKEVVDEHGIYQMLDQFKMLEGISHHTLPLFYVIDYSSYQYLFMSDSVRQIVNYDPREFLESGLDLLIELYHKDDFKVYNEKVFTTNMQFLKAQPEKDHHRYIFSYNFSVKRKKGDLMQIFQRGSYVIAKETGLPLYSLGMAMDISSFKRDTIMMHCIEKAEEDERGFITILTRKILCLQSRKRMFLNGWLRGIAASK